MRKLTVGHRSEEWKKLQAAINKRLRARDAAGHCIKVDGQGGRATMTALRYACWLLGVQVPSRRATSVSIATQRLVRSPRHRSHIQHHRGRKRVQRHRAAVRKRKAAAAAAGAERKRIVSVWKQAAANYRSNPGAYHYLAGGIPNRVILKPTPRNWRSDCSQFVAGGYHEAGVESPAAPLGHEWAATSTITGSPHARLTDHPKPGDLGLYGSSSGPLASRATHHVEGYVGEPGCEFIGHGSPPIDSLTPGRPNFYVTFDFLN